MKIEFATFTEAGICPGNEDYFRVCQPLICGISAVDQRVLLLDCHSR